MHPEKSAEVNGHKIEEFYWNGRMVTYVDNCKYCGSYTQAVNEHGGYVETKTA